MHKVYCTAPWNGVTVRENGDVRTCCQGSVTLGNLNNSSIQEILKLEKSASIKNLMLDGKPDVNNCSFCIQQETESGLASLRQHYIKYYPDIYPDTRLKNLDIRWNNSCNLGCMYCSPTFSSTWEDRLNIQKISSPVKEYQDDLLEFILTNVDQVEEIMLVGGEPMLMKQNYKLFKNIPKHTKISIITNLSYDLEKLPCIADLLDRPSENTIWSVSLENIEQQFEYVRNGGSWDQVEKNFKFLIKHWPNTVSVLMVYSMFNAFDIHNIIAKMHSFEIKKFTLQSYYGPPATNVFNLPGAMQQIAYAHLSWTRDFHYSKIHPEDVDLYPINNINFLVEKLRSNHTLQPVTKREFFKQIEWYDQWNTKRFCELWPNVIDLVNQHLL
jgi:MoaA/NifB/PqqE/SkfB family radical SAM enzyme